jgi:hypothetical protein
MARPESRVDIEHVVLGLHYSRHICWSMTCVREMRQRRTKGSTITYLDVDIIRNSRIAEGNRLRPILCAGNLHTYLYTNFYDDFCGQLCSSSKAASSIQPKSFCHYPTYFDHIRILSSRRSLDRRSVYRYELLDSAILYAHIGTGSAGGLTFGESARPLAQPAWRGGVLGGGPTFHRLL